MTTAAHNFSSQKMCAPSETFYFVFTDAQFLLQIILHWQNTDQKKDLLSSAVNNYSCGFSVIISNESRLLSFSALRSHSSGVNYMQYEK